MGRAFLDNIELWLSAAGIGVILAVPLALQAAFPDRWEVTAITATAVGALHGCIFWFVRRRQRMVRARAIETIRGMIQDRVNNHLATIQMGITLANLAPASAAEPLKEVTAGIRAISTLLETLSTESLRDWEAHYANTSGVSAGDANSPTLRMTK